MKNLHGKKILVIGDVMLDVYLWGKVTRISPEAPVPVVAAQKWTCTLGGAGNVAHNVASLGCKVQLFGVIGEDEAGRKFEGLLDSYGIGNCLLVDHDLPTTTKTRVMAGNQQLLRFDEETRANGHDSRLLASITEEISRGKVGAVILSDYDKSVFHGGLAAPVISYCQERRIPVFVDSKRADWSQYAGAEVITPNLSELKAGTGNLNGGDDDQAVLAMARKAFAALGIGAVLATRGPKGMLLVSGEILEFIPSMAREVFDVSGAGDTVIATLAAAMCCGYPLKEAAWMANRAAGIVVGKLGTQPISIKELEEGACP